MKTAIIGGGASGMMCAALLLEKGADVTVFEKTGRCGRKLSITGKGRCNLTNNCSKDEFFSSVASNPRFLYSSYSLFSSADTMEFFERRGVPLKTERGNRVFPVSDNARDVTDALFRDVRKTVRYEEVLSVKKTDGACFEIKTTLKTYLFDSAVIATGGLSYPLTGSTGDGYRFARSNGLSVTPTRGSLVPLASPSPDCARMTGLSLKNVALTIFDGNKKVYSDFGEMLFTHFGISGPMVLSASAVIGDPKDGNYTASIDLKPALDEKELDARLLRDFSQNINRDFGNSLGGLLPSKMTGVFTDRTGIPGNKKIHSVTRAERERIIGLLKNFTVPISGFRPVSEAIVTRGGVSVSEINPKTMEARNVPGLYFIGEVLDVDAFTGGFNLQIAFSTAAACARALSGD
jgi:predicted Rossmann fold flavoprotein